MRPEHFKEIIEQSLNTDLRFAIVTSLLESNSIEQVSDRYFKNKTIQVEGATVNKESDTSFIILGTGADLPFKGMSLELHLELQEEKVALNLIAYGEGSWTLDQSLPPFRNTLASILRFLPRPHLSLALPAKDDGNIPNLIFEGTIDLRLLSGGLSDLIGRQSQLLSGPILLEQQGSKLQGIDLVAPISEQIDLGIAKVDKFTFKVSSDLLYNPLTRKYYVEPYIQLGAAFPFIANSKEQHIDISARIVNPNTDIRFIADMKGGFDATLDEIKAITKQTELTSLLSLDGFDIEDLPKLEEIFFYFNPSGQNKIGQIGMTIRSTTPWHIFQLASGKQLVAQNIALILRIFGGRGVSIELTGEVAIGTSGTLIFSTRYPNWLIDAFLKEGTYLNLTELLRDFMGEATNVPEIKVDVFDLEISAGSYALAIDLVGDWSIIDEWLALEEIALSINQPKGAQPEAALRGKLRIADVDIYVSADYPDPAAGWQFQGSTGNNQAIPIGALIKDLADIFKIGAAIPSPIADLQIQNLDVSFNTQTKNFTFSCDSAFSGNNKITVTIDVTQTTAQNGQSFYTKKFGGRLTVGELDFELHFVQGGPSTIFAASYSHTGAKQSLRIRGLIAEIAGDDSAFVALIPESLEIELKDALFAVSKNDSGTTFLFGLDIGAHIGLSNLPLVGKEFPPSQSAGIDSLRLLVASGVLKQAEVTAINSLLPSGVAKLATQAGDEAGQPPADVAVLSGLTVSAVLNFGGTPQTLSMPVAASGSASGTGNNLPATPANPVAVTSSDTAKWFTLQKSFGPLHLQRVGVQYKDAVLWFLLDAALSAMGLTLSLDGLGLGSPISRFDPRFSLRGLGIDYRNEAVEIGGAFLKITVTDKGRTYDEYDGAAVVKAKALTLSAIGSYAYLDGQPSLFVYAVLDYPIGGPSFFFVTGLAAGFGYNRALIVPSIDQVAQFPLVAEAVKDKSGAQPAVPRPGETTIPPNPAERVLAELEKIRTYIPPSIGDIFLAVGIKFNSFKLIDSFALLTIAFGHRFELNVLGLSTLVAPPPIPGEQAITPLAEIQMALKASFIPDQGFLGVAAQLTSASYIISRDCHLTGGFAFYSWFPIPGFTVPNAGDFALTLGGYHPAFRAPAHYPRVPRLGINWKVNSELAIKGEAYYALTPSALMAGVLVDATWNSGNLKAWFHAGADFIIAWKPYFYDAHAFASLRVSYRFEFFGTHEINVDVSADLHLWGPEFSGTARIKLSVVEFDIAFGARTLPKADPISWPKFKESFLPHPDGQGAIPCCSISIKDGLVRKIEPNAGNGQAMSSAASPGAPPESVGVINPKRFVLITNSVIPSTAAKGARVEVASLGLSPIGVAPMAVAKGGLTSTHTISITLNGSAAEGHFTFTPIVKNVPAALWGGDLKPDLNGPRFVDRALSGFEIRPMQDVEPDRGSASSRDDWQYNQAPVVPSYSWESQQPPTAGDDGPSRGRIKDTIVAAETAGARARLLDALEIDAKIDLDPSAVGALIAAV